MKGPVCLQMPPEPRVHIFTTHTGVQSSSFDTGFHQNGNTGNAGGGKKSGIPNGTLKHCCSPSVQPQANLWCAWSSGEMRGSPRLPFLPRALWGQIPRLLLRQNLLVGSIPAFKGHRPKSISCLLSSVLPDGSQTKSGVLVLGPASQANSSPGIRGKCSLFIVPPSLAPAFQGLVVRWVGHRHEAA